MCFRYSIMRLRPWITDLTTMPAFTDAVYRLQHSHCQVALTAGNEKSDTSMALIAGQTNATWTQDHFYNNVSTVWYTCSKGFNVASNPIEGRAVSAYTSYCYRSARANKNRIVACSVSIKPKVQPLYHATASLQT